jgi:hypothetical protein
MPNFQPPYIHLDDVLTPGLQVTVTFKDDTSKGPFFLALLSGLSTTIVPIDSNNEATLPKGLQGVVFALVTVRNQRVWSQM